MRELVLHLLITVFIVFLAVFLIVVIDLVLITLQTVCLLEVDKLLNLYLETRLLKVLLQALCIVSVNQHPYGRRQLTSVMIAPQVTTMSAFSGSNMGARTSLMIVLTSS